MCTTKERSGSDSPPKFITLFFDFEMTSILLVIKILWIWRDFKLYFVILNFPDRTTRKGGKSEYLLLGPSYMVFILNNCIISNSRNQTKKVSLFLTEILINRRKSIPLSKIGKKF